ncbi:MAG: hypothetical protein DMF79_15255 [Acidobacteria bacterium]|nr:MAG: hypothetical protein DMF79_15255 [Acidobacteriota bacterium]
MIDPLSAETALLVAPAVLLLWAFWVMLLNPQSEKVYNRIERQVRAEMDLADLSYDEAYALRARGSADQARHLLKVGSHIMERLTPSMLRLLSAMGTFSRMLSAVAPVAPLRPRDFRLAPIVSLAYLNGALHRFLSAAERYRLRLYILGRGYALATRSLFDATRRIVDGRAHAERAWEHIRAIRHDLETLSHETLDSLRVLLVSLAAEKREDLLRRL